MGSHTEIIHLIEQHRRLIYKVVNSYCSDVHEQEDLIQEIIFQIIKGYEKFDHRVKVTTWMYKVAFNVSISHYRKLKSRQKYVVPMPDKLISVEEDEAPEIDENLKRLRELIDELDPLNKAILIMYLDDNSHSEISEAMGISVSNVGTKINRIKKQLKKKFNQ
ncbi:DNA-directed RNA polymerase sigma-70 factor [Prolixibacter bellariivorans]|uniref:DNA-directed RNA polymerase sigma-70 factor n=2 Tax=Prolixibacter bellariivorans TaxID=314319 RepID=A0A5M4B0E7_9BACT|nr:DNA-directed RNA polymerase sigma-70 factor [Prolixibacter bellariivorans]